MRFCRVLLFLQLFFFSKQRERRCEEDRKRERESSREFGISIIPKLYTTKSHHYFLYYAQYTRKTCTHAEKNRSFK